MSDLFVEYRYFKFQDKIHFFSKIMNFETSDSESFFGCNKHKFLFPSFASYYLHDSS